jgi:hypothetical protein
MKAHVEQALACNGGFSLRHLRVPKHPLQTKVCSIKDTLE